MSGAAFEEIPEDTPSEYRLLEMRRRRLVEDRRRGLSAPRTSFVERETESGFVRERVTRRGRTEAAPLDSAMTRHLKRSGLRWMMRHRDLLSAWNAAAGEEIAPHTRVLRMKGGVLTVEVPSAALRQDLEFHKPFLLQALRESNPRLAWREIRLVQASPEGGNR